MTDTPTNSSPESATPNLDAMFAEKNLPKLSYILMLVGALLPILSIIALVVAYLNRGNEESAIDTHYTFQIRTFWIGLLFSFIGALTSAFGIGLLILMAAAVWYIVRVLTGLKLLNSSVPVANQTTWGFVAK